jgi:hypothetical protein
MTHNSTFPRTRRVSRTEALSSCGSKRRRSESNRRMEVLQTSALPLGYGAVRIMIAGKRESRKAGKWEVNSAARHPLPSYSPCRLPSSPLPRFPTYPPLADEPNWASIRARARHKPIIAAAGG